MITSSPPTVGLWQFSFSLNLDRTTARPQRGDHNPELVPVHDHAHVARHGRSTDHLDASIPRFSIQGGRVRYHFIRPLGRPPLALAFPEVGLPWTGHPFGDIPWVEGQR